MSRSLNAILDIPEQQEYTLRAHGLLDDNESAVRRAHERITELEKRIAALEAENVPQWLLLRELQVDTVRR